MATYQEDPLQIRQDRSTQDTFHLVKLGERVTLLAIDKPSRGKPTSSPHSSQSHVTSVTESNTANPVAARSAAA